MSRRKALIRNFWTTTEDNLLRENWHLYARNKDLARLFPRHTDDAVEHRGLYLKLGRRPIYGQKTDTPLLVWWEMQQGPGTVQQIADRMGMPVSTIKPYVRCFKAAGVIYEQRYASSPQKGKFNPVWAAGDGDRMRKPKSFGYMRDRKDIRVFKTLLDNPFRGLYVNTEDTEDVCA